MAITAASFASSRDHRRHARTGLVASGRFVLDDAIEHRCRTIDVSPAGIALRAPTRGAVGQRVVCYLDIFGRLEGRIVRLFEEGFAVSVEASAAKRDKLAQQIAFAARRADREPSPLADSCPKLQPAKPRSVVRLADGRRVAVRILDLTRRDATVLCPVPLRIGDAIDLGPHGAEVARVARSVVTLRFDVPLVPPADSAPVAL